MKHEYLSRVFPDSPAKKKQKHVDIKHPSVFYASVVVAINNVITSCAKFYS